MSKSKGKGSEQATVMANALADAGVITITSARDLGFQYAAHVDGDARFADWAREHIPGFPNKDKVPDEIIAEFKGGCHTRYAEQHPPVSYIRDGEDSFVAVDDPAEIPEGRGFVLSVAYAIEMATHEFGKLLPNRKALVKSVRDAAKNYADLRWSRLLRSATEGEAKTRAANKAFAEWLNQTLKTMVDKDKRANANGDPTALPIQGLKLAIEKFREEVGLAKPVAKAA
jgi:hypothetical protein